MRTVERLDAEIYYEVHGENGPAVAHGRGGNAASWWQHFKQSGNVCLGSFPDIHERLLSAISRRSNRPAMRALYRICNPSVTGLYVVTTCQDI